MSIEYHYDSETGIIVVIAAGVVTIEDRAGLVENITRDNDMLKTAPILIDVSGITNEPELADVRRMAFLVRLLTKPFERRVAYWVTAVGLVTPYSLATFIANFECSSVQAFTDRNEAIEWLRAARQQHPVL